MGNPFKNGWLTWQDVVTKKKQNPQPPEDTQTPRPANVPPWQYRGSVAQTPAEVAQTAARGGNARMNQPIPQWLGGSKAAAPQNTEQVLQTAGKLGPTIAPPSWFYPGRGANVPQLWDKSQHFGPENYAPMTPGAAPATVGTFKQYFGDKPFDYWNKRLADEDKARQDAINKLNTPIKFPPFQGPPAPESLPIDTGTQTQTAGGYGGGYDQGGYGGGGYGGGGGGGYSNKLPPWYYGLSTWRI